MSDTPVQVEHRAVVDNTALVFVHGFGGDTAATWGDFPKFLMADPQLKSWGVFGLGYGSNIRVDVVGLWSGDAGLDVLAQGLRTALAVPPFDRCRAIAIAAHSMGGLVAQRAILSDPALSARLSHLFLYGTPSAGLVKAWFGAWLKPQLADMRSDGPFVTKLRADWSAKFQTKPPFEFRAVAGERDEFVPARSSIEPFPDQTRAVVPGNHIQIVKPDAPDHRSVLVLKKGLMGGGVVREAFESARLAVEMRKFQSAIDSLLPKASGLDDAALVALALALDGVGRGPEALQVLEQHYKGRGTTSIDALGVLGGRLKRRWLADRQQDDFLRARELYMKGLTQAEAAGDHAQGFYQAINIAFLDLMAAPTTSGVPEGVRDMARRALKHCDAATHKDHWELATRAEAALILENLEEAAELYKRAIAKAESERERDSMYSQAVRVAERVFGDAGAKKVQALSGLH